MQRASELEDEEGRGGRAARAASGIGAELEPEAPLPLLAHEVRNALAAVRDAAQLLAGPGDDAASRAHAAIEGQAEHVERVLDAALRLARFERGAPRARRDALDLCGAVRQAVADTEDLRAHAGQSVELALPGGPVTVRGDDGCVAEAFADVLVHVARAAAPGATLRVEVASAGRASAVVTFGDAHVRVLPSVPSRRARAAGARREGLLLVAARRLLELQRGTLEVRPGARAGEVECVARLPLAGAPPRTAERALEPCRVLIVEDDEEAAESQRAVLQQAGCEARVACDGAAALAAAREYHPDVVLLDIGLPDASGHDVARRLRARREQPAPLLVAITGRGEDEDVERSHEAGIHEHVTKPADPERLLRIISRWRAIRSGPRIRPG